ncbi:glycosyltransferase [bacterium]|nr:glycosyltransferase [candidate division CSSED10-310 bacterium]
MKDIPDMTAASLNVPGDFTRSGSSITLVIPAYNEESTLPATLERLTAWNVAPGAGLLEIVVVDDGSTDGTAGVVSEWSRREERIRLLKNDGNHGKGFSVCRGMRDARGDITGFTDADLAYSPDQYNALVIPLLRGDADIALGTRRLTSARSAYPRSREYSSRVFQWIVAMLGLKTGSDSQCGLKFFNRKAVDGIFPKVTCTGFAFDVEVLHIARRLHLKFVEVPVRMHPQLRSSTIRLRSQVPRMLRDLFRIRFSRY